MEKRVDARGLACPQPVIETKKALEALKEGQVTAIVDNEVAKENIQKFAGKMHYHFTTKQVEDNYEISIYKGELNVDIEEFAQPKDTVQDLVIVVGKDIMGDGERDLGEILMKGYFYALTEVKPYPKAIVFLNAGVHLTTEGSSVLSALKKLEENGCEIISCGTCLDFYNSKDRLKIGSITNMYSIVELMNEANNTITL